MRDLASNTKRLWYSLYQGKQKVYDSNGDFTGQYTEAYTEPVMIRANLSATRGTQGFTGTGASNDYFGSNVRYDRIISTCRMDLPINEHTVIWTHQPQEQAGGGYDYESAEYRVTAVAVGVQHTKYAIRSRQLDGDE